MNSASVVYLFLFLCSPIFVDCARILAVFPFQAKSHYNVYEPLLKRLSEKGHDVVSVSHFPQKEKLPNFTDVDISSSLPNLVSSLPFAAVENFTAWSNFKYLTTNGGVSICHPVLSHPGLKKIIKSKQQFDVYIVEIFATDCFLSIAHVLDIPVVVGAISSVSLPWANDIMGNPDNPSYIPNWFSDYTDEMDILQRTCNILGLLATKIFYRTYSDNPSYDAAVLHFGIDLPNFDTLRSRISLVLTNGHMAVSTPRPLVPGFKEVGGIHIPSSGPPSLPDDIRDYLDSHDTNGVIYFSLGSQIDSSTIPGQVLAALYRAFEQVPEQILWKCSTRKMPPLPKNVKCIEWAPQLSVLCHRNVKLFITHGGLLGMQEAAYCGVPVLGMPLFGDQYLNMAYFVKKGMALEVDFRRLSYERISNNLNELLRNKRYTEMAQKVSLQFKDRLVPPLEEATYWIEYLLRHGPDSLKTNAVYLDWFSYLLIDVILLLIVSTYFLNCFIRNTYFSRRRSRMSFWKKYVLPPIVAYLLYTIFWDDGYNSATTTT